MKKLVEIQITHPEDLRVGDQITLTKFDEARSPGWPVTRRGAVGKPFILEKIPRNQTFGTSCVHLQGFWWPIDTLIVERSIVVEDRTSYLERFKQLTLE